MFMATLTIQYQLTAQQCWLSVQSITLKVEFITSCQFDNDQCSQYSQHFAAVKVKAQKLFVAVMAMCHLACGVIAYTQ
jgi:hypothetical protein